MSDYLMSIKLLRERVMYGICQSTLLCVYIVLTCPLSLDLGEGGVGDTYIVGQFGHGVDVQC